eukprot:4005894-Alexandrium_andersonii.AAC.1
MAGALSKALRHLARLASSAHNGLSAPTTHRSQSTELSAQRLAKKAELYERLARLGRSTRPLWETRSPLS